MPRTRPPAGELACSPWSAPGCGRRARSYDPLASLSDNIETPDDRVAFLQSATLIVASKARIRMKAKSLYAADGRAVREMLKLASVLYDAVRSHSAPEDGWGGGAGEVDEHGEGAAAELASRLSGATSVRDQARAITERGVTLYELLEAEESLREDRAKALRFLDAASSGMGHKEEQAYVEKSVRDALREAEEQTSALQKQIEELAADERSLTSRLTKAKDDLERSQQRLATIKNVRPAFMDQYERLEAELSEEYASFVRKHRNLDYLERELDALERREKEKAEASSRALRRLQAHLEEEAVKEFHGDEQVPAFAGADEDADDAAGPVQVPRPRAAAGERPGAATAGGRRERPQGPPRHVRAKEGSMAGGSDGSDDSRSEGEDSDDLGDEEGSEGMSDLGPEDDLESDEGEHDDEDDDDDF